MYQAFNNLQAMKVNFRNRKVHLNLPKNQLPKVAEKKQPQSVKTQLSIQKPKNVSSFGSGVKPSSSHNYERIEIDNSRQSYVDNIADTIHLIGQQYISYLNEGKQQRFKAAILSSLTKLQARDRKIIIQYNFQIDSNGQATFDFLKEQQNFKQWLGQVHFRIVSTSFDFQINKLLTYQEVKVYSSQNLLLNIILFLQKVQNRIIGISLTKLMLFIDETLHQNIQYLMVKYPQAKQMKPNKRLRTEVQPINNIENDVNDLLQYSAVKFTFNQNQNYNSQIMTFINYIIEVMTTTVQIESEQFLFAQGFYQIMEQLFSSVYIPQNYEKQLKQKKLPYSQYKRQVNALLETNKQVKQFRQKVSRYSSYKIGTKINPNVELFSESQIKAGFFQVKSTSILRILTKWIQELEKKIFQAKDYLQKRSFRFKSNRSGQKKQYNKLNASQKNDLFLQATKQVQILKQYINNIRQNAFSIEGLLALSMQRTKQNINIPKNEYLVGQFSSKLQDAASSSLLCYLNQIIHVLLLIPKNIKQKYKHDQQALKDMDIDLVTFKISDLLRCKFSSHQNQIIRVYRSLKKLSDQKDYFKIVRIKDRLEMGTRDILINVMYMNVMICQIQLAITDEIDTKQQTFDAFNHYLYELKRANLGTIMQSACMWAHLDQRSRVYKKLKQKQTQEYYMNGAVKRVIHSCLTELVDNNLPFVCSICSKFYYSQQGIIRHKKCAECNKYYRCSLCFQNKMNQKQLKKFLGLDKALGLFSDQFKQWTGQNQDYPLHGLIVPKKNKIIETIFFTTFLWKQHAYIVRTIFNDKNVNETTQQPVLQIQVIIQIKNNDIREWKKLRQNYVIYEWQQKRNINITIKPASLAEQKRKQLLRKQEQENRKRQKRQKQIQEIKKKWKFKSKNKDKSSRPGSAESQQSHQSQQSKHSKVSKMSQQQASKKIKGKILPTKVKNHNFTNPGLSSIPEYQKIYNNSIAQRDQRYELRVAVKKITNDQQLKQEHYLILEPYLGQKMIREQLKKVYNQRIIRQNLQRKMEVLFLEDLTITKQLQFNQKQIQKYKDSLTKIHQIYLDSNYISSIQFLQSMPKLNVVHLNYNSVKRMYSFEQLKQLTELMLEYNQITIIDGISEKDKLVQVNLSNFIIILIKDHNKIDQMQRLQKLYKLEILTMANNKFTKIQNLDDLTNLKRLDLGIFIFQFRYFVNQSILAFNFISKIQGLGNLLKLQELDLSQNQISCIENIDHLSKLKKLSLYKNRIIKMQGLNSLSQLKYLDLHRNKISKIQNLENSNNLIYLNLAGNRIRKLQNLVSTKDLVELNLSQNQISSLKHLIQLNLSRLKLFDLSYNAVKKLIAQIFDLMPLLQRFHINSNPIKMSKNQRVIYQELRKKFMNRSGFEFTITSDPNQVFDTESEDDLNTNFKPNYKEQHVNNQQQYNQPMSQKYLTQPRIQQDNINKVYLFNHDLSINEETNLATKIEIE